jgi:predicted ArsR family transcriptional regulator
MPKGAYHPDAYLSKIKNVRQGLRARTRVLAALEKHSADAKTVASEAEMHYGVAMHHLKLLEAEEIVQREGGKPHVWALTGVGQKRLSGAS